MSDESSKAAVKRALAELDAAKRDVETAESKLETVLAEIRVAPRAEKTAVTQAIQDSLDRLRAARVKVADAESILAREMAATP